MRISLGIARLVRLVLVFGVATVATVVAADFRPGQYDEVALERLRAMVKAAPLHTTGVGEIAPRFVVAGRGDLTWDEAVNTANQQFGESQPARALFLRKYLTKGAPESRLDELHWGHFLGIFCSGPNLAGFLSWYEPLAADGPAKGLPTAPAGPHEPIPPEVEPLYRQPTARIDAAVANHKLNDIPTLSFPHVTFKGLSFVLLSFDENDRLVSVMHQFKPDSGGPDIQLNSETSGVLGDRYSASVRGAENSSEVLEYTPDLVLKTRWVQLRGRMSYHEFYEEGRLRKRVHTERLPKPDAQGRYVQDVEVFP